MYELFKDAPAFQWMEESVRQEERKRAEQQMREERQRAEQQMREERKRAEQQMREERKQTLTTFRQTVLDLVSQRFPSLKRLAKAQMNMLDSTEQFSQVMLRLSLARDVEEAQDILLSLQEQEDEGQAQEVN